MQKFNIKIGIKESIMLLFFGSIFVAILYADSIIEILMQQNKEVQESEKVTKQLSDLILEVDKIKLDTKVLNTSFLQNITALPQFQLDANTASNFGKNNPFSGGFTVVSTPASSTVGGVIYSNQRTTGRSGVISVPANRR